MNADQLKGKWNQLKGQIQERWGELTNDEVDQMNGDVNQLVGRIQERYGIAKEDARQQVNEWLDKH